jgi:hypothetical protein
MIPKRVLRASAVLSAEWAETAKIPGLGSGTWLPRRWGDHPPVGLPDFRPVFKKRFFWGESPVKVSPSLFIRCPDTPCPGSSGVPP